MSIFSLNCSISTHIILFSFKMNGKKITCHYFGVNGRGAAIRAILFLNQTEFEDKLYSFETFGPEFKDKTDYGMVPVLEVDGVQFSQTYAICLYLCRKFKIYLGNNLEQEHAIISVMCSLDDWVKDMYPIIFKAEGSDQEALTKKAVATWERFGAIYESIWKKNGSGKYFVGDTFGLADIFLAVSFLSFPWHKDRATCGAALDKAAPNVSKIIRSVIDTEMKGFFASKYWQADAMI